MEKLNTNTSAEKINAKISAYIAEERKRLRLTRADMANKLGVKMYMIARWENGGCNFTISELYDINKVINVIEFTMKLLGE